ncbi:hypothetical protein DESPIG_01588 [Desulfovibrio piger ATCC 29098]|uniref:Uncharacterized protein n=1 Tax=Desulfovibrio piger ATCC 29098 TaxID=411464 RepID=B6WU30_9BACT|nr:hypothetical protein DESPIG_01588 [Desulfovibrio piger ATCC 29098]
MAGEKAPGLCRMMKKPRQGMPVQRGEGGQAVNSGAMQQHRQQQPGQMAFITLGRQTENRHMGPVFRRRQSLGQLRQLHGGRLAGAGRQRAGRQQQGR